MDYQRRAAGDGPATSSVNAMAKIQALAQNTPAAPFSVTQTSPLDAAYMETPVNHIVVAFNHEVDASLVNYTTLTVERVDTEGAVESANRRDTSDSSPGLCGSRRR